MSTTTIGTIQLIAKIDTSQYKKGANEITKANNELEGSADRTSKRGISAMSGLAKIGLASVAAAAIAAGAAIIKNIGNAVSRVDTLNNFPKVMANLGYGADEAKGAIDKLDQGVRGLPTSLDQIVNAMQNISPTAKSLDEATNLSLALNNALLAGGKSADLQATGMEQFSQAIAKGRPDMMEWRSIATAMPAQLKQISNSLGFENWQQMAEAVADGTLEFDKVKEAIVSLNKDGLGELPSFAEQAKNATGGIGTGIAQMNTAITRGIANVIQTIGAENINKAIGGIGKAFEFALGLVSKAIIGTVTAFKWFNTNVMPILQEFWNIIKPLRDFVADQFMNAWEDLRAAFESLKQTIMPFLPQLKILGGILLAIALVPLALLVTGIVLAIGVFVAIITVIARLIGWATKLWAAIIRLGVTIKSTMENIGSSVRTNIGNVIRWFMEMPGRIRSAIGNAGSILFNTGRQIVQGLINGISNMIGAIRQKAGEMVDAIGGRVKKLLGINSPSKVFAEYGKNIAQGLALGVDRYSGLASKAISDLASDVSATMNPSINYSVLDTGNSGQAVKSNEVTQINNIYNQTDMDRALSDIAWRVAN